MAYFPVPWQRTEGLMLADTKLQSSRNKSSRENKKKNSNNEHDEIHNLSVENAQK